MHLVLVSYPTQYPSWPQWWQCLIFAYLQPPSTGVHSPSHPPPLWWNANPIVKWSSSLQTWMPVCRTLWFPSGSCSVHCDFFFFFHRCLMSLFWPVACRIPFDNLVVLNHVRLGYVHSQIVIIGTSFFVSYKVIFPCIFLCHSWNWLVHIIQIKQKSRRQSPDSGGLIMALTEKTITFKFHIVYTTTHHACPHPPLATATYTLMHKRASWTHKGMDVQRLSLSVCLQCSFTYFTNRVHTHACCWSTHVLFPTCSLSIE